MSKSQLNNLSKRQILESLMYEQNQSNATLSRLITAVARTSGVDPEKLAEMFVDDQGNQEYVEKFNVSVKSRHAVKQAENADAAAAAENTDTVESSKLPSDSSAQTSEDESNS